MTVCNSVLPLDILICLHHPPYSQKLTLEVFHIHVHPRTTRIYAHGRYLAGHGEALKAGPKEELMFELLQYLWHEYEASQSDCSLRRVSVDGVSYKIRPIT